MPTLTPDQAREIGSRSGSRLTRAERAARARIAALERWSREDPKANAERGQQGLRDKFRREIAAEFPDLTEAETERRATARFKAHMTRIRYARSRRPDREAAA